MFKKLATHTVFHTDSARDTHATVRVEISDVSGEDRVTVSISLSDPNLLLHTLKLTRNKSLELAQALFEAIEKRDRFFETSENILEEVRKLPNA